MKFHPFAEIFPLMVGAELKDIADDMAEHGLQEKIVRYQGMILDGRNRFKACEMSATEPEYVDFEGDDAAALAFVWSKNKQRRHLTESQRAMAVVEYCNIRKGQRADQMRTNAHLEEEEEIKVTQSEAAEEAGVSRRIVQQAKVVSTSGDDELIDKVKQGEITVHKAEKRSRKRRKSRPSKLMPLMTKKATSCPIPFATCLATHGSKTY